MKTLIFAQCYLKSEEQGRFLRVCLDLAERLNPDYDFLLIDNRSPVGPATFLGREWLLDVQGFINVDDPRPVPDVKRISREGKPAKFAMIFEDAIGHPSPRYADERPVEELRDGPGRAIMTGLRIAMNSGYDRFVQLEGDCLFMRPFEEGFSQMKKPFACLPRGKHGYLEWQVFWVNDLKWLEQYKFIERYDWPTQHLKQRPGFEGERFYEWILGEHLQVLPYKGGRCEGIINAKNLGAVFPDGCDWLTHTDTECFRELLRMHGHDDLADKL